MWVSEYLLWGRLGSQAVRPMVMGTIIAQFPKPKITQFGQKCTVSKAINCPEGKLRHNGFNTDTHIHTVALPKKSSQIRIYR